MKTHINFNDSDTRKRLERQAYDGTIDVADFPPAEYMYFSELRKIYYDFKFEGLSKEDAENRKHMLLRRYNEAAAERENFRRVYREYQDNIRRAGGLIAQIHKSQDIREIARLACTAIGLMQGDSAFAQFIEKKLEGLP
jgi:hypothetical protein